MVDYNKLVATGVTIQTKWLLFFLKPTFLPLKSSFDSCYFVLDLDNFLVFYFPNVFIFQLNEPYWPDFHR